MSEPVSSSPQRFPEAKKQASESHGDVLGRSLKVLLLGGTVTLTLGWLVHTAWTRLNGIYSVLPLEFRHFAAGLLPAGILLGMGLLVRWAMGLKSKSSRTWLMSSLLVGMLLVTGCFSVAIPVLYGQVPQQLGGMKPLQVTLMLQGAPAELLPAPLVVQSVVRSRPLEWVYDTPETIWVRVSGNPKLYALKRDQVKTIIVSP